MAFSSTCPKCATSYFELKEAEPRNSEYKIIFVQCSSCGAVVGTMPYFDAGVISKDNQKQIKSLHDKIDNLEHIVRQMAQYLHQHR